MYEYGLVLKDRIGRGSYEIGVWKALKELKIPVKVIVGALISALNSALMVQDDFDAAQNLWTSEMIESVLQVERQIAVVEEENKHDNDSFKLIKEAISTGEIGINPLKQLLYSVINEDKIRNSNIDLGLVTFKFDKFEPLKVFKSDIPNGEMAEYIIASTCYPDLKSSRDTYDNEPISLILEKKVKNLIVVDMLDGDTKKFEKRDMNIINIKPTIDLENVNNFDEVKLKKHIELGYYDTLKAFGKLTGARYYIVVPETSEENENINNIDIIDFKKFYTFLGLEWTGKSATNSRTFIEKLKRTIIQCNENNENNNNDFIVMAEITAEQLGIDRTRIYTIDELIKEILDKYNQINKSVEFKDYIEGLGRLLISRNQLEFEREVKKATIDEKFILSYKPILDINDETLKRFRRFIALAYPKISIANMFISLLLSNEKLKM